MLKPLAAAGAALAALSLTPAFAADAIVSEPAPMETMAARNFYVAARIGTAFANDTQFGVLGTTVDNNYNSVGFNGSLAVGGNLGFLGFPVRAELEGGYMTNGIDSHTIAGLGTFSGANAFGDTRVLYGLANAYIDFGDGPLKPYVGAGIGAASVNFDTHGVNTPARLVAMDDSGVGLAWQVGAGVSYALTETLTAELGYRYFSVENVGLTAIDGTNNDVSVSANQINLGLRVSF